MAGTTIPDQLRGNELSALLDNIRAEYGKMINRGRIHGLMIADQDAKVLAVNSFFDANINYWDIGAIGAALYGVSKQGKDFFKAQDLEQATMVYQNVQYFVNLIGTVKIGPETEKRERELILIILADKQVNMGMILMQMKRFAPQIKSKVEADAKSQQTMQMSETEFMKQITNLKKELFSMSR